MPALLARMCRRGWMLPILLGCGGTSRDGTQDAASGPAAAALPAGDEDLAHWVPEDLTEEVQPGLEADALGELMQRFADSHRPIPSEQQAAWEAYMSHGDEVCPGGETQLEIPGLLCTTDEGWFYGGIGSYEVQQSATRYSFSSAGELRIVGPEGQEMVLGGSAAAEWKFADGSVDWSYAQEGNFSADGISTWTELGASGVWTAGGSAGVSDQGLHDQQVWAQGSVGVGEVSLYFEDLGLSTACEGGASGVLHIRDPVGAWWALDYRVCGACPEVFFNGQPWTGDAACPSAAEMLASWAQDIVQ